MQERINLSVDVVKVNADDIYLEGAQVSKGEVKGASSISETGFNPLYLWLAVVVLVTAVIFLCLPGYLRKFGK